MLKMFVVLSIKRLLAEKVIVFTRYILFINSAQNSEDGKLGLEGETLNIAMADLVKRLNAKAKQLKLC